MAATRVEGLLGTVVEVAVEGPEGQVGVDEALAEIERLEGIFSVYRHDSELCRWRRSETEPGPELASVVAMALEWTELSGGAFNPFAGRLVSRWRRAEAEGVAPDAAELDDIVAAISRPSALVEAGDLDGIELNAIAKGHIVDRAVAVVGPAHERMVVNAGGDLVHRGRGRVRVGIEDPFRRYDNAPALTTITIDNAAVATSGSGRRGFSVAGTWRGHVIDPRTGMPTDLVASATAVAATAAAADALSTAVMVLGVVDGVALAERVPGTSCFVVGADRKTVASAGWPGAVSGA